MAKLINKYVLICSILKHHISFDCIKYIIQMSSNISQAYPLNTIQISDLIFKAGSRFEPKRGSTVNYKNKELLLKTDACKLKLCTSSRDCIEFEFEKQTQCIAINEFLLDIDALISTPEMKKQLFGQECNPDDYYPLIQTRTEGTHVNWKCTMEVCPDTKLTKINEQNMEQNISIKSAEQVAKRIQYKKVIFVYSLNLWSRLIFDEPAYGIIAQIVEIMLF